MFNKQALFDALKPKTAAVDIDGFGQIRLRQLSVREVEAIRNGIKEEDKESFWLQLVVMSCIDQDGKLIFGDADMGELQAASNAVMEKLVGEALKLNGFLKDDAKN